MVTVWRAQGFRIVIFTDDHEPAHVHVFGDGELKINLHGPDSLPALVWAKGMKRGDIRRAVEIVTEQRLFLLKRWRDIHG
jgi:hypothetical protein